MTLPENPAELIIDTITKETSFPVQRVNADENVEISKLSELSRKMADNADFAASRTVQATGAQLTSENSEVMNLAAAESATDIDTFTSNLANADQHSIAAENHSIIAHDFKSRHVEESAMAAATEQAANITRGVVKEEVRKLNISIEERRFEANAEQPDREQVADVPVLTPANAMDV